MEIKFQGNRIEQEQFDKYDDLNRQCAIEKKVSGVKVSEGFKLSLFRYPEDVTPDDPKKQNNPSNNGSSRGRRGN